MGFFSCEEIFRVQKENVKPTKWTPKKENKGYKMHTQKR